MLILNFKHWSVKDGYLTTGQVVVECLLQSSRALGTFICRTMSKLQLRYREIKREGLKEKGLF